MSSRLRGAGGYRKAIVRFLRATISFRGAALWIVGTVTAFSVLVIPFKATIDGILYISSAKSLFQSDFATRYIWYREPGYPFFLWTLHLVGNDGLILIAVQAVCLGLASFIALYAVRRMLHQVNVTNAQLILTVVLTLNPMYLIYSALVLQQALFALQLALCGLGVVFALRRPTWMRRSTLLVLVMLNYFAAIWTSIGWLYLALIPVTLTIVLCFWPGIVKQFTRAATAVWKTAIASLVTAGIIGLCALVYVVGLQVYNGWDAVKAPYLSSSSVPGDVIAPLTGVPYIPTVQEMTRRTFALMHMGVVAPYTHENDLFFDQQMVAGWASAQWDTAFKAEPYTSYAKGYYTLPNPSPELHDFFSRISRGAPLLYSAAFVGFLLALALSVIRRKWALLLVLSAPLAFLLVYAASNSPIDRYGVPAYPWAVASVGVLCTWLGRLLLLTPPGKRLKSSFGADGPSPTKAASGLRDL